MFHRRPHVLGDLPAAASTSIATLSAMEGFGRALLVGIVPLLALETLGDKQTVTYAYLAAALFTMMITLNLHILERFLRRKYLVTLGGAFLFIAAALFTTSNHALFALGIGMRSAAASIFSVCLSLYIMDYINRDDLTHSESRRMQFQGAAWFIGPSLGLWLFNEYAGPWAFLLSMLAVLLMLSYFWYLRLSENTVVSPARSKIKNPLKNITRYVQQRRLRIAYGITLSRSCYWVACFVYGPIYIIEAELPKWMAGVLLSGISALMFFSPVIRNIARRIGSRQVIIAGLGLTGCSMLALGLLGTPKPIGLIFWVTGALGGVALDVLGNIPFMRSVKPHERSEMTMVFSTWREASELITPALVTVILLFAPFWAFYMVLSILHFTAMIGASYLPRRI